MCSPALGSETLTCVEPERIPLAAQQVPLHDAVVGGMQISVGEHIGLSLFRLCFPSSLGASDLRRAGVWLA